MARVIVVAGMHRSGTSLIVNSLKCLGAELGPRAEWSGPDNPKSFGEDRDIVNMNEFILRKNGASWDAPGGELSYGKNILGDPPWFYAGALNLIRGRLRAYQVFGIKDPRLCLTLPFWKRVFADIGCDVALVHAVRHPGEVAMSLYKRNHTPIQQSLELWRTYVTRAREHADPAWPSVTVAYDGMMSDPRSQIARMGAALGLPIDEDRTARFIDEFVDSSLRHHADDRALPPEIETLWDILQKESLNGA